MTEELLPCPFCGGEARLIDDAPSHCRSPWFGIGCASERCIAFTGYGVRLFGTRAEAIDAWNRRADHDKCHIERDWDCDEPLEARLWRCDACGSEFVYESWLGPDYCPKCGREAV